MGGEEFLTISVSGVTYPTGDPGEFEIRGLDRATAIQDVHVDMPSKACTPFSSVSMKNAPTAYRSSTVPVKSSSTSKNSQLTFTRASPTIQVLTGNGKGMERFVPRLSLAQFGFTLPPIDKPAISSSC